MRLFNGSLKLSLIEMFTNSSHVKISSSFFFGGEVTEIRLTNVPALVQSHHQGHEERQGLGF